MQHNMHWKWLCALHADLHMACMTSLGCSVHEPDWPCMLDPQLVQIWPTAVLDLACRAGLARVPHAAHTPDQSHVPHMVNAACGTSLGCTLCVALTPNQPMPWLQDYAPCARSSMQGWSYVGVTCSTCSKLALGATCSVLPGLAPCSALRAESSMSGWSVDLI